MFGRRLSSTQILVGSRLHRELMDKFNEENCFDHRRDGVSGKKSGTGDQGRLQRILGARNNKQNIMAREVTSCTVLPMDVTNVESVRDVFVEIRPTCHSCGSDQVCRFGRKASNGMR